MTRRTGMLRIAKVRVLSDRAEFTTNFHRYGSQAQLLTDYPDGYQVNGACMPRPDWVDRDPNPYQAMILLAGDALSAANIAHEATHAAMHFYSIDGYRDHARASAHLHLANEIVPYLVGDIFGAIADRCISAGYVLPVGDFRNYRDA